MSIETEGPWDKPMATVEKAEGALLALAAGDALGWPQEFPSNRRSKPQGKAAHVEFESWIRRSGGRFQPFEEVIHAGDYSDDTQLTLAIARCRTSYGTAWWKALTRVELPIWTVYERGGGGATKRAAHSWTDGRPPWRSKKKERIRQYFDAGGNGVAMRVLPHALFHAQQEQPRQLLHDVVLDGTATHGHPRALIGATAYAHAAWSLVRRTTTLGFGELLDAMIDEAPAWGEFPRSGENGGAWFDAAQYATNASYESEWEQTVNEMRKLLEIARRGLQAGALADDHAVLKELGCFGRTKGAGTNSAAAAAYLVARHAAQPVQGVLRPAFEKGADTDTLAAMVGGLMGCLSGSEWLPSAWLQVQDADYLRKMASSLCRGPDGTHDVSVELAKPRQPILSDLIENSGELGLGPTRKAYATALPDPKPIARSIAVKAWRLHASDGQTMYVTKVARMEKQTPAKESVERRPSVDSVRPTDSFAPTAGLDFDLRDRLYADFCKLLPAVGSDRIRPREIERALGLVRSQVKTWLARAEQDGFIQRTSKSPAMFILTGNQLIGPASRGPRNPDEPATDVHSTQLL